MPFTSRGPIVAPSVRSRLFRALALGVLAALPAVASAADALADLGELPLPVVASRAGVEKSALPPAAAKAGQVSHLQAAGDWLLAQQSTTAPTTGALPWTPGGGVFANTQGASALGWVRAHQHTGSATHLAAAVANAQCQIAGNSCIASFQYGDGDHRFATHDPLFLVELSNRSGNAAFADFVAAQFWDKLAAGDYGSANDLDAGEFADLVLASRTSQNIPELVAWDLSKTTIAAHVAGRPAIAAAFLQRVTASLEAASASNDTYDVIGLAGGLWTAATLGVQLDPTAGTWAPAQDNADLAQALLARQAPGGGFVYSTSVPVSDAEADVQTTSFAMQALYAIDPTLYRAQIAAGFAYITSLQQPNGQYLPFAGADPAGQGAVESHGEALEAYAVGWIRPDRYVNGTGGNDTGDCSEPTLPCRTIQYAVDQADAGNTIHVQSGNYIETVTIAKAGLRLLGEGPSRPVIDRVSGPANQHQLRIDNARNVQVENFEFRVDKSYVGEAIVANGNVDGLRVAGNLMVQRWSNTLQSSTFRVTNAISINRHGTDNTANAARFDGSSVTIENNTITGSLLPNPTNFRACISMDSTIGRVRNNPLLACGTHDLHARFMYSVAGVSGSNALMISGNTFGNRGLELSSPNSPLAGGITVQDNVFNAPANADNTAAWPAAADFSLVRLIGNGSAVPTAIASNTFAGHANHFRGVLLENWPGVQLIANTFTPKAGAADFASLVISNKEITSDSPPAAPRVLSLTARLNTFNGSGVANAGRAVELLNDNDAAGSAAFGALLFGAAGFDNDFDPDHRWYFRLDDHTCNTHAPAPPVPQCTFLGYTLSIAAVGSNTQVRPFGGNVNAANNRFGGVRPADMSAAQLTDLVAHTQDDRANAALGLVDYGVGASAGDTYVDDAFAGAAYGDERSFTHSGTGTITVYYGVNAFDTIPAGLGAVADNGRVFVAKGSYAAPVTLAKNADLLGDGAADANPANSTVLTGGLVIAASGTSGDSLRVAGLRSSNPAGDGITLTGSQSHVTISGVFSVNNLGNGMQVAAESASAGSSTTTTHLRIEDSEFTDNGADKLLVSDLNGLVAGLLFDENASVDGLAIVDSKFDRNNAAGLSFNDIGAPASNSIIRNVTISGSSFSSNNRGDTGSAGGGIWLKTSGAGSRIENVDITSSTFADNGTGRSNTFPAPNAPRNINANGISVRVRAGTFLSGVRVCGNTFAETAAPGTQEAGIYVFDQTGHTGYQPIEVCSSNVFSGLARSVSGYEQYGATLTQPVVRITGAGIAGTEAINAPVLRVGDGALFTSFTQALADAGTLTGETLRGGAGRYTENLVVAKNDITIEGIRGATLIEGRRGPAATPVNSTQPGIQLNGGVTGSTVRDLTVQNFGSHCVLGAMSNHDTTLQRIDALACTAPNPLGSVQFNGGAAIDGITLADSLIDGGGFRGFVIWDGVKTNLSITGNTVRNIAGCCGIELQDGAASGVRIQDNVVSTTGDNGLGLTGLTSGAGANLVTGNTVSNGGRYGIEVKNPNGSGVDIPDALWAMPTGMLPDGAIIVAGNQVSMVTPTAKVEDVAGIAVMRRGVTALNADVPAGVVVRDNTVSNWTQPNANDGFGIVVEGTKSRVFDNVLAGNDVAIQLQAGNAGYPGDAPQAATNDYFSRANSPSTCSYVGSNTVGGAPQAGATRSVSTPAGLGLQGGVQNATTLERFCSIQAAIADSDTLPGHVITVEAGTYAENVVVNKRVTLLGAKSGIAGDGQAGTGEAPAARDGTGESVISPASGRAITINASGTVLDGFTFTGLDGAAGTVALGSGGNFGGNADDVAVRNNRFVALANTALYTNGPTRVARWTVSDNLFDGIAGSLNSAVNLWKADDSTVRWNTIRNVAFGGIQLNENTLVRVLDNRVDHTGNNGINIGPQVDDATVRGNVVTDANHDGSDPDEAALTLYSDIQNLSVACNVFDQGTDARNAISTKTFAGAIGSGNAIFHNRVIGRIQHNNPDGAFEVFSNWHDGAAPATGGTNAAQLRVAEAMTTNPIGNALCGDNTATQLVRRAGSPQSAEVQQPFAQVLEARVVDALGAAVPARSVAFAAPAAGASALLAPASGTVQSTDYNGVAATAATANAFAGSYVVTASSPGLAAVTYALANTAQDQVSLDLTGPVAGVEVGDEITYQGVIRNTNATVNEQVFVRLVVGGSTTLDPADVSMCVVNPANPAQCAGFAWTDLGATLAFDFPGDLGGPDSFDITSPLPYAFTHAFRTVYGKAGVFSASAQIVGETSGTIYATDVIATEVIAQAAGISLDINGPVAGVEKDAPTLYSARLRNEAAAVRDNVVVEFALSRSGGIQAGDVTVEYDTGGGNFALIPLMAAPGELVAQFGGAGFPLGAGYDATSTLRVTYHVAPHTFSVAATVIDAGADTDGVPSYAADQLATAVIESDPDILLTLSGPFTTADGTTAAAPAAGGSAFFRSTLDNLGGNVADQVARSLQLGASYGAMTASDVVVEWWRPGASATCATQLAAPQVLALASDGTGGLEGDFGAAFALAEDFSATLCFEVDFQRAGVFTLATLVADAGADTDGSVTYAADNLSTVVAKGAATLSLSGLGPFTWDGTPRAAVVTTTPASLATVSITYNGSATVPSAAGTYTVFASLANDDYAAPAVSGTMTIGKAPVAITGLGFAEGGTSVVYNGGARAVAFTASPAAGSNGIACSTLVNGGATPPLAAGSYAVTVQCDGPNHSGTASATLTVAKADSGIVLAGGTFVYDGAPKPASVANANGASYTLTYAGTGGTSYAASATPPVNAGTYLATLTVNDANYSEAAPLTAALAIDPATVTMAFGNLAHVYSGSAKAASVTTTPAGVAGVALSYAPDAVPVNAGSYTVTASLSNPNYVLSGGNSATMTIAKATAQVTLADLTQLYDGAPKPVTVSTQPAPLAASTTVTYAGSTTPPSAVGSYAVVATVNDLNHAGTASGTLTILAAAISQFQAEGPTTFAGTAGLALGTMPAVKVTDAGGNGVPSVSVQFEVASGGGSGGGIVTTDATGVARAPAWVLGRDAGANTMTARVAGLAGLPTLVFTANGTESTDLGVQVTSLQVRAEAGQAVTYAIVVTNAGPSNAAAVSVMDVLPAEFAGATWTCTGNGGALCGVAANANGSGDVDLDARIPAGGSLSIQLVATLASNAPIGTVDNVAVVTAVSGTDPVAANNSDGHAIDVLAQGGLSGPVFRDGFENP